MWRELRGAVGDGVQLMGAEGIFDPSFLAAAGAAAEGTYVTSQAVPPARPSGARADWDRRYRERFRSAPNGFAAHAYDAMGAALAAIERAGKNDRAAVRDALLATHDYDGVLGTWSFTASGDTSLTAMSIVQARDGRWDVTNAQVVQAP